MKINNFSTSLIAVLSLGFGAYLIESYPKGEEKNKKEETINDDSNLIEAMIQVESRGNEKAIGDTHLENPSVGVLQIRPIMVEEVNRILKKRRKNKQFNLKDRFSKSKSIEMFNVWKDYYHPNSTDEKIARCWNGGPLGWKRKSTLRYWKKVQKELKGN